MFYVIVKKKSSKFQQSCAVRLDNKENLKQTGFKKRTVQ